MSELNNTYANVDIFRWYKHTVREQGYWLGIFFLMFLNFNKLFTCFIQRLNVLQYICQNSVTWPPLACGKVSILKWTYGHYIQN